jgi:hypothetical protein
MIGFQNAGRMGNWLFECATTLGLALRNDVEFSVPSKTFNDFHNPLYTQHLVNHKWQEGKIDIVIQEPHFHYAPIEYKKEWDNSQVELRGYWQSEKYWSDFKKEVIDLLAFPYIPNEGFVSVHLRRTDFITYSNKHPEVKDEWYNEAMAMFPNKKFIFFSDEINYCKEKWGHRNDCYFSEGKSIEQDMIDMSCCVGGHINSASTYSWWGSYLDRNEDKKIITPKLWFTPNWDGADTKDIIPESWIKL